MSSFNYFIDLKRLKAVGAFLKGIRFKKLYKFYLKNESNKKKIIYDLKS